GSDACRQTNTVRRRRLEDLLSCAEEQAQRITFCPPLSCCRFADAISGFVDSIRLGSGIRSSIARERRTNAPFGRFARLLNSDGRGSLVADAVPPSVESATMQYVLELGPGAGGDDLSGGQTEGGKGDGRLQRYDGMPVEFRDE